MSQVRGENMRGTRSEVVDSASAVPHRFVLQASRIIARKNSFRPAAECYLSDSTCEPCLTFIRNFLSLPQLNYQLKRTWLSNSGSPDFPTPVIHSSECVLCRLFLGPRHFKSQTTRQSLYSDNYVRRGLGCTSVGSSTTFSHFEFVAARDEKECAEMPVILDIGGQGRYPADNIDSEQLFDKITEWFKTCVGEHRRCIRGRPTLPTRLLRTGTDMDFSSDKVWLSKTRDLRDQTKDIRYLALSYCWGGTVNMRTLRENVHIREKYGLHVADLPAVIRDAITVARKLKFEYLWVDSLCICQDDEQEWKQEAALMADIYGGSVFTISALSSPNANVGFLGPRQRSIVPIGSIEFSGKGEEHDDGDRPLLLFIREEPQQLHDELRRGSLSQRGWPLQERILAPGVLHFGRDQVFWECNEDEEMFSETGDQIRDSLRINTNNDCSHLTVNDISLWGNLLRDFSCRDLTIFSDRLHAISGLAARLRRIGAFTGRYVAGLWESRLDVLLLWSKSQEGLAATIPVEKNTRISTWSWAHTNRHSCFHFYSYYVWYLGSKKSSLLAPAKFQFKEDAQDLQSMRPGAVVPSCEVVLRGFVQELNRVIIPRASESFAAERKSLRDYVRFQFCSLDLDDDIDGLSSCYYSIRMMDNATKKRKNPDTSYRIEYLVLEKADSSGLEKAEGRSVYKRIGRLSLDLYRRDDTMKPYPISPNPDTDYPDIFLDEETPFLTNGQWQEIILI